ncbi:MAG: precorrin-6y C5,15-methyltransferase (decarboxylating) subunit CbiE [Desulfobacterales bacterium]|nr:precorrin-6y C5,15-methyltransferase (decarboxylating) subunit CbiE [Desulfobacterales bacterium]
MKPVKIIGMGLAAGDLTETHLKMIHQADILVGRKRLLGNFKDFRGQKKTIEKDLDDLADFLKDRMEEHSIVVLVSGDPLFFGVGPNLIKALGPDRVVVFPNMTLAAAAFSRIKAPWQDARVINLDDKDAEAGLVTALGAAKNVVVYTRRGKNPAWLARLLLNKGLADLDMCVLEQLGTSSESMDWFTPAQAAKERFRDPNLVVLKRGRPLVDEAGPLHPGMPDEIFERRKGRGVHPEIRAVILSRLRLSADHIFWDLGAGNGAISAEASLFVHRGRIFAVERNHEMLRRIEVNKNRFNIRNLEVLQSHPAVGLDELPPPDRVRIGAGDGDMVGVIRAAENFLKPGGVMVIDTERVQDLALASETMKRVGLETDFIQIQVSRGRPMPGGERLAAENPVWIVSGRKSMLPMVIAEPKRGKFWSSFRANVSDKLKRLTSIFRKK